MTEERMREIELILFSGGLDRLRADAVDALLAEVRRLRAENEALRAGKKAQEMKETRRRWRHTAYQ